MMTWLRVNSSEVAPWVWNKKRGSEISEPLLNDDSGISFHILLTTFLISYG